MDSVKWIGEQLYLEDVSVNLYSFTLSLIDIVIFCGKKLLVDSSLAFFLLFPSRPVSDTCNAKIVLTPVCDNNISCLQAKILGILAYRIGQMDQKMDS